MVEMASLAEKLQALSDSYAAQLPEKLDRLGSLWLQLSTDGWNDEDFQHFLRLVHSMSGSGKTFGFSMLSDVARQLEKNLKQFSGTGTLPDDAQCKYIQTRLTELRQVALKRDALRADMSGMIAIARDTQKQACARIIYIVEDDIEFAENLKNQLHYYGYEVTVFNRLDDFRHAVSAGGASDVVVVMDISFPEDSWGGIHVMQEVQQNREQPLPVVFLSVNDALEARLEAVRVGGIAFFNKAMNVSSLIDKLDELTSHQQLPPCRVLIVDDSPALTGFYAAVLEQAGMSTRSVNDPLSVMGPLLEFEPDLILIDLYMPGCDGMELAKVIRQMEIFVGIPIVFLSAEQDMDKQLSAMYMVADDFLTKPIQPQHLVAAVGNRMRRSMRLRSFMLRDSLTGLLNHTAIKDQLDREVARAKRQGTPFSFAMVDIDHFKRVNDTYGHPAGDRVIKSLSRLLRQRLRENDSVGRYGGEEFAVILADANGAAALRVMDTIREDFSRLLHQADGREFSVTFSCGIAEVPDFMDAVKLGNEADKALYKAKQAGRNRVMRAQKASR